MHNALFQFEYASLAYHVWGTGKKTLVFFHGYGQHGKIFEAKVKELGEDYQCILIDLFFHGDSKWHADETVLTPGFWQKMWEGFLTQLNIGRYEVAAFSLGGRFALACLHMHPERILRLHLLAPDGIKTNFLYNLATYPIAFRNLFKSMIVHPNRFFRLAKYLNKLKLIDKGLIRFAESQMRTPEMRARVYYTWVVFRKMQFDTHQSITLLVKHEIPLTITLGKYDKVIVIKHIQPFIKHVPQAKLIVLETGHNGIIEAWHPTNTHNNLKGE
jgi:pimeloyl-ACP methyl ester carboxylesterase